MAIREEDMYDNKRPCIMCGKIMHGLDFCHRCFKKYRG